MHGEDEMLNLRHMANLHFLYDHICVFKHCEKVLQIISRPFARFAARQLSNDLSCFLKAVRTVYTKRTTYAYALQVHWWPKLCNRFECERTQLKLALQCILLMGPHAHTNSLRTIHGNLMDF